MPRRDVGLKIKDLKIKYKDQTISYPDFCLEKGERLALTGKSGSGKTSLLMALMGLIPYEGQIEGLEGQRLSVVFQEDRLIESLDLLANIRLTSSREPKEIRDHLRTLGLGDHMEKKAKDLSGGMKRRLALARALLTDSDILILDEAFKGLDKKTKEESLAYVKANLGARSLILVSHDQEEIDFFACQKELDMTKTKINYKKT